MTPEAREWSDALSDWHNRPGRSVAAAIFGLVLAWCVGAVLIAGMVEVEPGAAAVSDGEFLAVMGVPLAVGAAFCASGKARQAAGFVLPGAVVGWLIGCMTFALLAALS